MNFRVALVAAAALLTLAWPGVATATPDFPGVIQRFVGSSSPPACTICHNNPSGGFGTVTTTFGTYMRSRGLLPLNEASLTLALMASQGEMHVSNSLGITDIDALRADEDPNNPKASTSGDPPPASFGCGAHISPSSNVGAAAATALLVVGIAISVQRRRRSLIGRCGTFRSRTVQNA